LFDVFAATDPPTESQYCGDDQHAKDVATALVRGVGFHGVNLRSIAASSGHSEEAYSDLSRAQLAVPCSQASFGASSARLMSFGGRPL
jgi:predicted dinucleotide-binding enzyme